MIKHLATLVLALALRPVHAQDLLTTYDQALGRNPAIRQAESTRNAALESKPQSVARLLPTLSLAANMNRSWVTTKSGNATQSQLAGGSFVNFWNTSPMLTLSQPLYHHDLWVQLSQADNQVAAAEAAYMAAQQQLMQQTASAYFNILFAQDALDFANMTRTAIGRQLEQAKARFDVGLIAITDVNAAQAGYDEATANAIRAENDLQNAREAMRVIIGQFDGVLSGLADDVPLKAPEPADMEQWSQRAQESNLNVIAAQNQFEQAQKGIEVQFAGHLPTLDLVGQAGFTDNNRPNGVRTEVQTVGVQLNVPLFQGGLVNSRVRQARELATAAEENLEVQKRNTVNQVKTSYRGINTSISQVAALRSAVASAQSALDATQAGFEVGTRTMIDVLILQSNLFKVKQDYAKARYDYITNSILLKQATGILTREDLEMVNQWLTKN